MIEQFYQGIGWSKNVVSLASALRGYLAVLLTLVAWGSFAQERTITGTVTSTDEPGGVPGVNVAIVGTTRGTQTDAAGKYTLSGVTPATRLRFTFINMVTQEVTVGNQGTVDVVLEADSKALSEVVVVGYGTQSRREVTGAVAKVQAKDFNQGAITSPAQLIQGKVAGAVVVYPGGDPNSNFNIRVRGTGSLSGGNNPLFIVDGIPGVDPNTINPSDIESFDVLKDASAAIYGARASGGVILITTKRGAEGRTTVNYDGSVAFESVAKMIRMLTAAEWRTRVAERGVTGNDQGQSTDWQKEITRSVLNHFHTLSVSGGTAKSNYIASVNYQHRDGIVVNSGLRRLIGRFNVGSKFLNDKLNVNMGITYTQTENKFVDYSIFNYALNYNPTFPIRTTDPAGQQYGGFYEVEDFEFYNPVAVATQVTTNIDNFGNRRGNDNMNLLGTLKLDYTILPGLTATVNTNINRYTGTGAYFAPSNSRVGVGDGGRANRNSESYASRLLETYASYNREIGSGNLSIVGGYSWQDFVNEGFFAQNRRFITNALTYNNLSAGQDMRPGDVTSYKTSSKLISFFGRASVSLLNGRYLFQAGARRDGSSKFGANNKWGFFPFVSAGVNLGDMSFMNNQNLFSTLKFRFSWGSIGNQDAIPSYASIALVGPSGSYYEPGTTLNRGYLTGYGPSQNPNPNLRWETTTTTNFGLDFGLLGNRINGALEYYIKDTKDLLYTYSVPVPPNLFPTTLANVGRIKNHGLELTLNGNVTKSDRFSWDMGVNFSANRNNVVSLSNDLFKRDTVIYSEVGGRGLSGQTSKILTKGLPAQAFYGPVLAGLYEEGTYKFIDPATGEAVPSNKTDAYRTYLGQAIPRFQAGLNNSVRFGNFDFSIFFRGLFGYQRLNATMLNVSNINRLPGNNIAYPVVVNGIRTDRITESAKFSSMWVENADHVRLDNMTLGYTFKTGGEAVKRARLYVTGQNLFVITNYSGVDPEGSFDGNLGGIEGRNYYPRTRTITAGVNLSF